MKIAQDMRNYVATLGDIEKVALGIASGISIYYAIEDGMATMGQKFCDMESSAYIDAKKGEGKE